MVYSVGSIGGFTTSPVCWTFVFSWHAAAATTMAARKAPLSRDPVGRCIGSSSFRGEVSGRTREHRDRARQQRSWSALTTRRVEEFHGEGEFAALWRESAMGNRR